MDDYERLAEHLDRLPGGFHRTESGVEMRILRRLFSPDQAALALHLTLIPEEARVVARRAGIGVEEAEARLEKMARSGLITSLHPKERPAKYMATQAIVGFYEFQVAWMDEDFARDASEYLEQLPPENWQRAPQMRTIPVGESISARMEVMAYEQAETLIASQTQIRVSPCICRKKARLLGHGCDKPLETCLAFGSGADYYARNGVGRDISKEEALAILQQANDAGLVLQPGNTQRAGFLCCCCGDCCGILQIAKRHPRPASILVSPFFAEVDGALCSACGDCEFRCQMEAIGLDNGYAVVNRDRCIGCGLCVTTCPDEAVTLVRKAEEEQRPVPATDRDLYIQMLRARGVANTPELAKMLMRSKVDRLRAR
ncbi:MAG: 4Fe-4S binding protein [Anaerolineae bacterium]|nr:4Fe-4S binding protein [Anaerolineae bacterium]